MVLVYLSQTHCMPLVAKKKNRKSSMDTSKNNATLQIPILWTVAVVLSGVLGMAESGGQSTAARTERENSTAGRDLAIISDSLTSVLFTESIECTLC